MFVPSVSFLRSVRSGLVAFVLATISGFSIGAYADCPVLFTLNDLFRTAQTETKSHGRPIIFATTTLPEAQRGLVSAANLSKTSMDGWVVWHGKAEGLEEMRSLVASNSKVIDGKFSRLDATDVTLNLQLAHSETVADAFSRLCKMKMEFPAGRKISTFQSQPFTKKKACESLSVIAAAEGLRLEYRDDTLFAKPAGKHDAIAKPSDERGSICDDSDCIVTSYGRLQLHKPPAAADSTDKSSGVTKVTLDGAVLKMLNSSVRIESVRGCANRVNMVLLKEDNGADSCDEYRVLELKSNKEFLLSERFGSCASIIDAAVTLRQASPEGDVHEAAEWRFAFSPHSNAKNQASKPDWFVYRNGKVITPTVSRADFVEGLRARQVDGICGAYRTRRYGGTEEHCVERLPRLLDQCELSMRSEIPERFSLESTTTSKYRVKLAECVQLAYQKMHWNSPKGRKAREQDKMFFDVCLSLGRSRAECEQSWGKHPQEKQI